MTKYFGALVLIAWGAMTWFGYEPFTRQERGTVPAESRRGPGGVLLWHSGFRGGK
ncbi:MAG: hypothetical protein WBV82_14515 [Myxococcaceae bacterium]